MRSKLLFLMLAAVLLAGSVQANIIANSGFEVGIWAEDNLPDDWWTWGSGEIKWMSGSTDDGTAYSGDKFIRLDGSVGGNNYVEVAQNMMTPIIGGNEYYWGVYHKDSPTVSPNPPEDGGQYDLSIRWYDEPPEFTNSSDDKRDSIQRDEYYDVIDVDVDGNVYPPNSATVHVNSGEYETAPLEWTKFVVGPFPAPEGATHVTVVVGNWYADWTTWVTGEGVLLDDMYFGSYPFPSDPVYAPYPADEEEGVPPDESPSTTTLSWQRDRFGGRTPQVEVYWGQADDPNFWIQTPTKIMDLADTNDLDLADAIGGSIYLEPDGVYYWAVKYEDPNKGGFGIAELTKGSTWSFDTINRPPTVDAGLHCDKWQDAVEDPSPIVIGFDASYIDDGLPVGGNLTYEWTETLTNGATTPSYDSRTIEDPTVTFSTAGNYFLTLAIHDDLGGEQDKVGEGTVLIRIFANDEDRLRAHYPLNTDAADSVGGHHGSLVDNASFNPSGQVAGAVELDGSDDVGDDGYNDHVSIDDTGSDPNWQADTWDNSDLIDGMTISAWMKLDEDGWSISWEAIVAKSNTGWELQRNGGDDNLRFVVQRGMGEATSSDATDVTSGWHQVVGVYDRNTIKIYVDGLESGSGNANRLDLEANSNFDHLGQPINDQDWQVPKAAGKIRIGAGSNVDDDLAFAGLIDQVRIFDAAVPKWAEHDGTPGIVGMYRADGGHASCGDYLGGDLNEDCYITLADFALVAGTWLECNDEAEADCD